jgi:hypothetical protein
MTDGRLLVWGGTVGAYLARFAPTHEVEQRRRALPHDNLLEPLP